MVKTGQLNPEDVYLFHEGNLFNGYRLFGAHFVEENDVPGVRFTLWAPQARAVKVVGDFNHWQGQEHAMEKISLSGIWSLFVPGLRSGELYKYEIHTCTGDVFQKADPFGFYFELRPRTASIIYDLNNYYWQDGEWVHSRKTTDSILGKPLNIYEVHLGSWKRGAQGEFLNYRELATKLVNYVTEMGYTHLELLPVMEHPLDGSWGYQITGYYGVTSRYGSPEDFMYFVDYCHQNKIGVILDWVPGHFCKDCHGLSKFDGTPLYEGGENKEWGTWTFDYGKPEVRSFLISNAVFWFDVYHVDGLRVDAAASMLYLDYGKKAGEWRPNMYGGRENVAAVRFMKRLNEAVFQFFPAALMIAEESTSWPLVTKPTYLDGLGYNYKWNMGWMNDVLRYMETDPFYRKQHHKLITFSLLYAFTENFILPLSHDEMVHGKKSLIEKMPGDYWRKFANLRLLFSYMIAHPGKKLFFMGSEFAQFIEWRFYEALEWGLLQKFAMHQKFHRFCRELNRLYLKISALWEEDHDWDGFKWLDADNSEQSIVSFIRYGKKKQESVVVICNFTPATYQNFRQGVPDEGIFQEVFNSDDEVYGGSGQKNSLDLETEKISWHNQSCSLELTIPPLAVIFLQRKEEGE
ncbi:MAG: 1,4-alpha-glucan branching protein GlgB [Peptococcaceae bacterium]